MKEEARPQSVSVHQVTRPLVNFLGRTFLYIISRKNKLDFLIIYLHKVGIVPRVAASSYKSPRITGFYFYFP